MCVLCLPTQGIPLFPLVVSQFKVSGCEDVPNSDEQPLDLGEGSALLCPVFATQWDIVKDLRAGYCIGEEYSRIKNPVIVRVFPRFLSGTQNAWRDHLCVLVGFWLGKHVPTMVTVTSISLLCFLSSGSSF